MTNKELIQKIKQEVIRRFDNYSIMEPAGEELYKLIGFLDTLLIEEPIEGLDEAAADIENNKNLISTKHNILIN